MIKGEVLLTGLIEKSEVLEILLPTSNYILNVYTGLTLKSLVGSILLIEFIWIN